MEQKEHEDLEALIKTIQKEHRSTRLVFGIGIIVLCVVLIVLAPAMIRNEIQSSGPDEAQDLSMSRGMMHDMHTGMPPHMATTTASTTKETK